MRRIRIIAEYDGTNYVGWQVQPNGVSVQEKIQDAIFKLMQEEIKITGSGRTDAGVHALHQVIHFDCSSTLNPYKIQNGLNFYLPLDIRILSAEDVQPQFHARYDAIERTYRYFISFQPTAVNRYYRWVINFPLDIEAMKLAATLLVGKKDFKSFCSLKSPMAHYDCHIFSVEFLADSYEMIFEIKANRFLHGMVRSVLGTLIEVGKGNLNLQGLQKIIELRDRTAAGPSVPARGLFLTDVKYKNRQ